MRISVAMCTYNGQRYIQDQLESLACQKLLPKELILCDDASTDGTLEIAESFARESPFHVKIFRNKDRLGYRKNFIKASNLCSEGIIALCDQDDVWYPRKLSLLSELFAQEGETIGGIFSNGDLIDANSEPLSRDLWTSFGFRRNDQERFRSGEAVDVLLQRNVVTGMSVAFRSKWRNLLVTMPESWHHDAWLALMLASRGRLVACPEKLVAYRIHDTQQVGVPPGIAAKYNYIRSFGP